MSESQKPVPRGLYPRPFNAVLSPEGRFYLAEPWKHEQVAYELTGEDWDDLARLGWLRIAGGSVHYAFSYGEPTQAQLDAIFDYTEFMGWRIDQAFEIPDAARIRELFGIAL